MKYIDTAKQTLIGKRGTINIKGITLEWEGMLATNPLLTTKIQQLSDLLVATYLPMELAFAKQHPEAVATEFFLKPLNPLFQKPEVNWHEAEHQLRGILEQFFSTTDFAQFAQDDNVCLLIISKAHEKPIGMIQFLISPEYEKASVKAGLYAAPQSVAQLLMSSIFKILPDTKRIFLHTRSTNESALRLYRSWGFTRFDGPLPYWTDVEYLADKSSILQNII